MGGDFTQMAGAYSTSNFSPDKNHRTVLNGTGEQVISFASGSSGFGTLEARNEQLVFKNYVNWLTQASDIHATSSGATLTSRSINLNGHTLAIEGDIRISTGIDINAGRMTVDGTLYHNSGTITFNGGQLSVTGDYLSVGANSVFEPGRENIVDSTGYLEMKYAADEMRVGGEVLIRTSSNYNALTAGTLYVGGDFTQMAGAYSTSISPL